MANAAVPENPVVGGNGTVIVLLVVDAAGVITAVAVKAAKTGRMGDDEGDGTVELLDDVPQAAVRATPRSAARSAQACGS